MINFNNPKNLYTPINKRKTRSGSDLPIKSSTTYEMK
jgi:hypothetical protein